MKTIFVILIIFSSAFILNLVWEQAHHVLYTHYKGGGITNLILLRAALFDALFITVVFSPFVLLGKFKRIWWTPVVMAFVFAIGLERFAIQTGRWAYLPSMPVIPFLKSGITPTIQLSITGFVAAFLGAMKNQLKV